MSPKIEEQLEKLIENQKTQSERDTTVLNEVANIRKSVERLHERFDEMYEKTIIHGQKIISLEEKQTRNDEEDKRNRDIIWKDLREAKKTIDIKIEAATKNSVITAKKDIKLWLYGAIAAAVGSSTVMSIFIPLIKTLL